MQYLDETGKKLLCGNIDKQVKELDAYLVEAIDAKPDFLYNTYVNSCIDAFTCDSIEVELKLRLDLIADRIKDNLTKTISTYVETAAMLWWAAGGIYEGKSELGDFESIDSPINYLFQLVEKSSTYNGIVKALADIAASKKLQSKKAAKARWDLDPRTEEKAFVKSCWLEWQAEPSRYKSKAAFLRDMHQKLDNLTLTASTLNGWIKIWLTES